MSPAKSGNVLIQAVGDVHIDRDDPASAFSSVAPVLKQGDINLGNLEGLMCDRGQPIPGKIECGSVHLRSAPSNIKGLTSVGFKAMALANNHNMDYQAEGLAQTIEGLDKAGIAHSGGGSNLREAHKPAIVEHNGLKVALLSNTSVYIPVGYAAEEDKAGLATVRVHTSYETPDNILYQPGFPPIIITTPDPIEADMMLEDIRQARKLADIVVVYPHWGVSWGYARVVGYQKALGRAAIDAGADLVLGSHPHRLQGMEIYKGKLIAYSMGNFVLDKIKMAHFGWDTIIVKIYVRNKKIVKCSIVPARINQNTYNPELLGKEKGLEVVKAMETMSEEFGTTFTPDGEEAIIGGPKPGTPEPLTPPAVYADTMLPLPYLRNGKPYEIRKSLAIGKQH